MPPRPAQRRSVLRRLYRSSPRLRRKVRATKNRVTFDLVRLAMWYVGRRSLDEALALADRAGDVMYALSSGTRRLALEHLALAFGETLTPAARERIARACFRNVLRCFAEVVKFDVIRSRLDDYVSVEGLENLEAALGRQQGVIVVTGHMGNWELLAAYCALKGLPVAAVARRIYNPQLNRLIVDFRAQNSVKTILREGPSSSREILSVLRRKGILAMVIDQDTHAPSVSVPFFGQPARTPAAAASLALRGNLPVLAAFAQRRPGGGHRLSFTAPLTIERSGDRKRDIIELTRVLNRTLEERVRANPAEWVWWHRRWRRGPAPQLDLDAEVQ
jgi:KDO2-lipid IV(A) lauroyltransferase